MTETQVFESRIDSPGQSTDQRPTTGAPTAENCRDWAEIVMVVWTLTPPYRSPRTGCSEQSERPHSAWPGHDTLHACDVPSHQPGAQVDSCSAPASGLVAAPCPQLRRTAEKRRAPRRARNVSTQAPGDSRRRFLRHRAATDAMAINSDGELTVLPHPAGCAGGGATFSPASALRSGLSD